MCFNFAMHIMQLQDQQDGNHTSYRTLVLIILWIQKHCFSVKDLILSKIEITAVSCLVIHLSVHFKISQASLLVCSQNFSQVVCNLCSKYRYGFPTIKMQIEGQQTFQWEPRTYYSYVTKFISRSFNFQATMKRRNWVDFSSQLRN